MGDDVDFWKARATARQANMVKANVYRSTHKALLDQAEARCRAIVREVETKLENLAVEAFGMPIKAKERQFAPPKTPVQVKCWHCGKTYQSDKMRLEYRPALQHHQVEMLGEMVEELHPLWWCKDEYCDGAGFGFDIHEVKQKGKPEGRVKRKAKAVEETP